MSDTITAELETPPPRPSRFTVLLDRLTHPIVLKELRQASRGAFLLRAMLVVQILAFGLATVNLLLDSSDLERSSVGLSLFNVALGCGVLATCAVVPFFGFLSLGAEREMSTLDLLHLTRLRPGSIVFGKLVACFVLTLLFCASLAPLVVLSYLLPGLDLRAVLASMVAVPTASLLLTACAIGLSGIVSSRLGRALASVVLIIGLFLLGLYGFFGIVAMMQFGGITGGNEFYGVIGGTLLVISMLAVLLISAAMIPLTHFEENRAFAPRMGMLVNAILVIATVAAFAFTIGLDDEAIAALQIYALALHCFSGAAAMTEAEKLPKRVLLTVPRRKWLAALRVPFLFGGGRGFLFFVAVALFQILGVEAIRAITNATAGRSVYDVFDDNTFFGPMAFLAYAIALFGPLSAIAATADRGKKRARLRVWMFLSPFVLLVSAIVFGFVLDGSAGAKSYAESSWNPFWLIAQLSDDRNEHDHLGSLAIVIVVAAVGFAVNLPRMIHGFTTVFAASAARNVREKE